MRRVQRYQSTAVAIWFARIRHVGCAHLGGIARQTVNSTIVSVCLFFVVCSHSLNLVGYGSQNHSFLFVEKIRHNQSYKLR